MTTQRCTPVEDAAERTASSWAVADGGQAMTTRETEPEQQRECMESAQLSMPSARQVKMRVSVEAEFLRAVGTTCGIGKAESER